MNEQVRKISVTLDLSIEERSLYALLDELGIVYDLYQHNPVHTVEEGQGIKKAIPGQHGKNLFLTNKTGQYWLVCAADETRADLKALSDKLKTKRFSFGKPESLKQILNVEPGHVNPFNLRFDTMSSICTVVIDVVLAESDYVVFHPWRNDKSIVVAFKDLLKFIQYTGHTYSIEALI